MSKVFSGYSRWCPQGSVVAREDISARFFERNDWYLVRVVDRDTGEIIAYIPERGLDDPVSKSVIEKLSE